MPCACMDNAYIQHACSSPRDRDVGGIDRVGSTVVRYLMYSTVVNQERCLMTQQSDEPR